MEEGAPGGSADIFHRSGKRPSPEIEKALVKDLHAKLRELVVANRFFAEKAQTVDRQVRRSVFERNQSNLSVGKQCGHLSLSRPSFFDQATGKTDLNGGWGGSSRHSPRVRTH